MEQQLQSILAYWLYYAVDESQGGFYGRIDHANVIYADAPKGAVLNSRILWAFSAAYNSTKKEAYLKAADRAFAYLIEHFIDPEEGGVFWTVDCKGIPLDTKKQIYALAFALYGFSEYFNCRESALAKKLAKDLFDCIEKYSYDSRKGGYLEAFTRDWKPLEDLRLSEKDANEKKTMNTNLHVLEAYTNLYRIWPEPILKRRISGLLDIFFFHIINEKTGHLHLFFDEDWNPKSETISYGHDIEAAWLLEEAAEVIEDPALVARTRETAVTLAIAASEGLDSDGGLWYEWESSRELLIKEKHSWPQAEAMVGFFNAWQVSNKDEYLQTSLNSWNFTRNYILDNENGEWFWGVRSDNSIMSDKDKAGIWKCPYHNSRACLEIVKRLKGVASIENDYETYTSLSNPSKNE